MEEGRTLVYALPDASSGPGLAALLGTTDIRMEEAAAKDFHLLTQINVQHPLFAPFADSRFGDFTKLHFWKHRRLSLESLPSARVVLAKFDDDSPAIVEIAMGKGKVLLLTSGWKPSDSQLALSTKFIPLLYSILDSSRGQAAGQDQYRIGNRVSLPISTTNGSWTVQTPDGSLATLHSGEMFSQTDRPGVYRVKESGLQFAVNIPGEESRTTPLPAETLERLGLPVPKVATAKDAEVAKEQKRVMVAAELENRQKYWQWLVMGGLVFLAVETWMAGRLSQPRTA